LSNLLITGPPRCGKTTLVKKIIQEKRFFKSVGGFLTEEIRGKGARQGFEIISIPDGRRGMLAKKGLSSSWTVGRYGVNIEDLEKIACQAVQEALRSYQTVIIDEIGKMELFSEKFKDAVLSALDSSRIVLATIMERKNEFADRIKKREDVDLFYLNQDNFDEAFVEIQSWLTKKFKEKRIGKNHKRKEA